MTTTTTRRPQPPRFPRIKKLAQGADPRFMQRGRCGTAPVGLFDERGAGESDSHYLQRVTAAAETCASCPVTAACLEFGMANRETGFLGGQMLSAGKPRPLPRRGARS